MNRTKNIKSKYYIDNLTYAEVRNWFNVMCDVRDIMDDIDLLGEKTLTAILHKIKDKQYLIDLMGIIKTNARHLHYIICEESNGNAPTDKYKGVRTAERRKLLTAERDLLKGTPADKKEVSVKHAEKVERFNMGQEDKKPNPVMKYDCETNETYINDFGRDKINFNDVINWLNDPFHKRVVCEIQEITQTETYEEFLDCIEDKAYITRLINMLQFEHYKIHFVICNGIHTQKITNTLYNRGC